MTKAILTTKVDPAYDDLPEERYHFPRTYLRQVEAAIGDWILYYEPRRRSGDPASSGGRQAYFATARLMGVIPDGGKPDHFYALVADYLEFDRAVPFRNENSYYEKGLQKADQSTNKGAFRRAVRNLTDAEYQRIVQVGFANVLGSESQTAQSADRHRPGLKPTLGLSEDRQAAYEAEFQLRNIVTTISQRPFRDRAFAMAVKNAYQDTCVITGLKLINGGGRSEVQAAHIRPVAHQGPDSVRNGVALSGTIHWLFDRGLISIDDDLRLLVAGNLLPDSLSRLVDPNRRLIWPERPECRPHPQFLRYHRETVFQG
jgi:putative restriction endonuclease